MAPKSQTKIKTHFPHDFKEDRHKFFSQFSILNLCSEMYFLSEQFIRQFFPISDSKLMFWNVFFEGAIYTKIFFPISDSKLMFSNVFFEGAIYLKVMVAH